MMNVKKEKNNGDNNNSNNNNDDDENAYDFEDVYDKNKGEEEKMNIVSLFVCYLLKSISF